MNKLILVTVCFFCCGVCLKESACEDSGILSYLVSVLQYPPVPSLRWETFHGAAGDQTNNESGGILSTIEQLLLFPICLMEDRSCNKPLEKEGETGHGLQICKGSSDTYLLEYVIESGKHVISDAKAKLTEAFSLLEWENLLVPLHYLKAKILYLEHLPSLMSRFESRVCHSATSESATQEADGTSIDTERCTISYSADRDSSICSRTEDVFVVTAWAFIRYIIAGIIALSLLRSVIKIDIREIIGEAKCLISQHEDTKSPASGPHFPSSPVTEDNSPDISSLSFFRTGFLLIPLKTFGWSPPLEEFSEFEHYPMCEYFDTKTCNCGGKPLCSEETSKSRHFKMCEIFDSMPCNCGGTDEKSNAYSTTSADASKDISGDRRNGSYKSDNEGSEFIEYNHIRKEQSVQAVPDVVSRHTSPNLIHESDENEEILTDDDKLLQIVQRLVDNCLTLNYPHLKLFKSRTVPKISTYDKDDETISTKETDNREHQGAAAGTYLNQVNTFLESMSETAYPRDSELPVNSALICKGPDSKVIASDEEITANDQGTEHSLLLSTCNDLDSDRTAPAIPFGILTSTTSPTVEIVRLSQRISDLIKTYETNMRSDKHTVLNENVGHLNMDKKFIERLNSLLYEGYKVRYYSANLCTGNLLPTFSINVRNITKPLNYDNENNKELDDSTNSEKAISVHSDHDNTVSSMEVESVDKMYKARESQPKNFHDNLNDSEKLSESAGNSTEMPEEGSKKDCKYHNTYNDMVDNAISLEGSKFDYLQEKSKSQYLEEVSKSEYLEEEQKSKYVEEEPKSDYLEKEAKSEYIEDESKSEYLDEESKSEYLEEDSNESFFDLSERDIEESQYLEKESKSEYLEDSYESLFQPSERDIGKFVYLEEESKSECLEENSHESSFDLFEREIGSPCHNSSFKDNSPYTTAETVPFDSLQACGDGAMYYTLTRRSPFSEAGLNDLSVDMSARDSERSIFDVSDINSSISIERDAGILELAVILAMQTMWRLAKRFWQKKLTNTSHCSVAIEEKENGLFVIGQMQNSKTFKSPIFSINNSATNTVNNQDAPFESCSVNKIGNGYILDSNSATENVNNSIHFDTNYTWTRHVQDDKVNDVCHTKSLNSESSSTDDVLSAANNQNNNARVWKQKSKKARRKKAVCENNINTNERDCSETEKEASVTYSNGKTTKRKSLLEYRSGDSSKRRLRRNKNQTTEIRLPFSNQKERKRRTKQISNAYKDTSNRRRSLHRSPNTVSEKHDSSGSSSYRSGDMADESSNSSDEKLDIRDTLSKMGICDVVSGKPIDCSGIKRSEEQVLADSNAFHVQINSNACTCITCRSNMSQNPDILSSLPCNVWERREFRYIDNKDNKSKVLAWAWSCVEKYE